MTVAYGMPLPACKTFSKHTPYNRQKPLAKQRILFRILKVFAARATAASGKNSDRRLRRKQEGIFGAAVLNF